MKSRKTILLILAALVLVTAIAAVVHLTGREQIPEGAILVQEAGSRSYVDPAKLNLVPVQGTVVNGKGETREIDAMGVELASFATGSDYSVITVTSDDSYNARVMPEEMENAFLILTEDGTMRLIVFGDENAKRDVKNVVQITVEP